MVYDVCAAVLGDLAVDARVWKQARSLAAAGYAVKLIGCAHDTTGVRRSSRYGIDLVEVPLGPAGQSPGKARGLRALVAIWAEIGRTPSRTFHSHNIHVLPASVLAARRSGGQVVYDAHELYGEPRAGDGGVQRLIHRASRWLERYGVRHSALVITTNPSRRIALQARHGLRDITVLANVPYLKPELKPLDPGYPKDVDVLLYQGGIYAEERPFRQCIQALALLPDVHFAILGFGRDHQIALIHEWAREEDVADRVHVLPPVPFEQLVDTAAPATVGIVPLAGLGLDYYLGDTNKLHEYLMAGLPVIASDMPEVRRVLEQGSPRVGEFFDPAAPESIAAAYLRITEDRRRYDARRAEARRLATQHHNWGIEERVLLDAYARLLGDGASSVLDDASTVSDRTPVPGPANSAQRPSTVV